MMSRTHSDHEAGKNYKQKHDLDQHGLQGQNRKSHG